MGDFSGVVKLANVSDFIAPSQSCVVNLDGSKKIDVNDASKTGNVQIHASSQGFSQTKKSENGAIKVTLNDCLACSGCVTSAETVLLEQQSIEEFKEKLMDPKITVAVSISPQSRASLGALFGIPPTKALRHLSGFFKSLGVDYIFDLGTARDISLIESAQEFLEKLKKKNSSMNISSENGEGEIAPMNGRKKLKPTTPDLLSNANGEIPMLASACPGWVCYAEKTHGDYILPYIAKTMSPQAIMGCLVKNWFAKLKGINPKSIYHCSIMPCYDKKLEASREDFKEPDTDVPQVDSCLTSSEVLEMIQERSLNLIDFPEKEINLLNGENDKCEKLYGISGGSGGYMEYIFKMASKELFGENIPPGPLQMKTLRNADFKEIRLKQGDRDVLRFAVAYGFRNIQTLVRKIKRGNCEYEYIEIMACPSGCLNGGGQIKPQEKQSATEMLKMVEDTYNHQDVEHRMPLDNPMVQFIYCEWVGGNPGSDKSRKFFHTQYHKREKSMAASIGDW